MHETTLSQQDLALLLQVNVKTIQRLTQQNILHKEPGGQYGLVKAVHAYLQHKTGDFELREQRIQLMRQQQRKQAVALAREAADLVHRREMQRFVDLLDDILAQIWQAATSHIYHGFAGIDEARRMLITHNIDLLGKDELLVLRQRMKNMLAGLRDDLKQEERIELKLQIIAGEESRPERAQK